MDLPVISQETWNRIIQKEEAMKRSGGLHEKIDKGYKHEAILTDPNSN